MTDDKFAQLKRDCAGFLTANGAKPKTKTGAKMVHTFWYGALCALDEPNNPGVCIRLLSGRHDELCDFNPKPAKDIDGEQQ